MEGQQNIEKDNTTECQESLETGKSSLPFASKSIRQYEKSKLLLKERLTRDDPMSSSSKVVIKLSAERLVSRRKSREEYLIDTWEPIMYRAVFVEFLVDLTEIELEFGKQVARQEASDSEYFDLKFQEPRLPQLMQDRCLSVVVTQTEEKKVSDRTIKTFSETFYRLNELFHPGRVNVSGCTLLTQVLLLPGLLSAHDLEWPSMRVVCQFSKDFLHLEEDECIHLLNLTKTLVVQGDISKEQFQELINKLVSFFYNRNEKVTHALIEAGSDVNMTDKDGKTPLLHVYDDNNFSSLHSSMCKILLESGSSLCETTKEHKTVFHLAIFLCQEAFFRRSAEFILPEIMKAFKIFSQASESKVAVNKRDMHLNSPLHLWASLALASPLEYRGIGYHYDYTFERRLKSILNALVKCGIKLNYTNKQEETPLHVCRTWTAVKLLLDAGAKADVTDSSGCTPLLAAAKRNTCIEKDSKCFYPDVDQTPNEFWKNVLKKKLDPWTADKNGDSVLSILIRKESNCLAKALIETACELKLIQSDATGVHLLIVICRDKSIDKEWKVDLVKTLLKYRNSLAQESLSEEDTALHICCMNMLELPENSVKTSVHWKIAQHLILCGADVEATDNEGKSCLDIAESCPVLKELLLIPINTEEVFPLFDSWRQVSNTHQGQLEKVSRGIDCQQIETVYYFKEALDNGTFGLVFVGINTQDGKEVAVKRIEKPRVDKENLKEEIDYLKLVMRSDKVIQCLLYTDDKGFVYVVLELMEGNLDNLLSDGYDFVNNQEIKLCRYICTGLDYLHNHEIIHKAIKPTNILYQVPHSGIRLKLAYFGLRSQMCKEQCTSGFTDTYESLTEERRWMAPEVLHSQSHSKSSDVFSCGLVIHYLLTNKKHPFAPAGPIKDSPLTVSIETVDNIIQNRIELDETISSDAKDLLREMLDCDTLKRKSVSNALQHKFFQPKSDDHQII